MLGACERLRALVAPESARRSASRPVVWTLDLAAEVSFAQGSRHAGQWRDDPAGALRLGVSLEAGQALDHQPRSRVRHEKKARDRLIRLATAIPTWALGFQDEVWWSRLAQPEQHRWVEAGRHPTLQELTVAKADPDPKALACYGLLLRCQPPQPPTRCGCGSSQGAPSAPSPSTSWTGAATSWRAQGFTALLLIWDNASWHAARPSRAGSAHHNQQVKQRGVGVRIVACHLPIKSPWLNAIEAKWVHGKRAVSKPDRLLTADELEARVYAAYGCQHEAHLVMPKKVA